ncbi:hypothetical protein K501DRAFT_279931 [Backusella circina FSU 941]|nr:hypothetical protein K501DRAFT_279931 [Backusella circina FSU 941]
MKAKLVMSLVKIKTISRQKSCKVTSELHLDDFTKEEVDKYYNPIYLDPGRKHVLTAVTGSDLKNKEARGCSTKVYYSMTGTLNYQRSLDKEKINSNVKKMETDISTGKRIQKNQVKFKGLQSGVLGTLWRALEKRESNTSSLIVVTIDKCRMSRVCSSCKNNTFHPSSRVMMC